MSPDRAEAINLKYSYGKLSILKRDSFESLSSEYFIYTILIIDVLKDIVKVLVEFMKTER